MTIQIAIFEDEQVFMDELARHINDWATQNGRLAELQFYRDGAALTEEIAETCDILFFDIELAGEDGMTAAKRARSFSAQVPIVFMTSYTNFMQEGYRAEAYRYYVKPVKREDCFEAMDRAQYYHDVRRAEYLSFKAKNGIVRVLTDDIYYIEVQQHHCTIVTEKEEKEFTVALAEILNHLPSDVLMQCHRSYVVNCRHIHAVRQGHVHFKDGREVPVSRTYYQAVLKKVALLMEE